jgi:hypothetical protein
VARSSSVRLALALALAVPATLAAQDSHLFVASLSGGIGGSFDAGHGHDFGQTALQAGFGMLTHDRTYTMVRLGRLDFNSDFDVDGLTSADLSYLTVAGEYRFQQPSYDFGIYLGLGGYQLAGRDPFLGDTDERALGLAFGLTGDFDITRRFSLVAEFSAHYAFLDRAQIYGLALGGVAFHF